MMTRWFLLTLLLTAAAGSGTAHGNRRERRQTDGSCIDSEGQSGSCVGIRACAPLNRLLREAKRGGPAARDALNKLRQETFRCPFSRSNPLVCCATAGGGGNFLQQTSREQARPARPQTQPLFFAGDNRRTTQRPQFFTNPATTQRPQFFSPTRRTTQRPQQFFNPTRRTTQRPQQFFNPTRRTTRRPQFGGRPDAQFSRETVLPGEDQCGRRTFSSRIIGGEDAEIGAWPWAASVGYRRGGRGEVAWNCGATLITARYLVTAAHCVSGRGLGGYRPEMVRVGELNFDRDPDCLSDDPSVCADRPQDVPIASTMPHPGYQGLSNNAHANDIALIRLARSVRFTEFVRPICLPLDLGRLREGSDSADGLTVYAVGWGRTDNSFGTESMTPLLQEVKLQVTRASDCERTYGRSGLRSLGSRLCVTGDRTGADTCSGDSGGPLMVHDQFGTNWYITGVTSFGSSTCGQQEAVYTRVHDYIDWIRGNVG